MTQEEKENLTRRLNENRLPDEPIWRKIERCCTNNSVEKSNGSTECYVYLMEDKANGRYKIGMSKKPEYRERTLQSEKPEISLVCSRKYSSREEARQVEKELHQKFKKSRIRGEWFNLSATDTRDNSTAPHIIYNH